MIGIKIPAKDETGIAPVSEKKKQETSPEHFVNARSGIENMRSRKIRNNRSYLPFITMALIIVAVTLYLTVDHFRKENQNTALPSTGSTYIQENEKSPSFSTATENQDSNIPIQQAAEQGRSQSLAMQQKKSLILTNPSRKLQNRILKRPPPLSRSL